MRPGVTDLVLQPEENWVMVYGFSTKEQFDEVLSIFERVGFVAETKTFGGSVSASQNWVAINYEDELSAVRARARHPTFLSDGCICGIDQLQNPHAFFLKQQNTYSTVLQSRSSSNNSNNKPLMLGDGNTLSLIHI